MRATLFAVALALTPAAHAGVCSWFLDYGRDMVATRGARFFAKPAPEVEEPRSRKMLSRLGYFLFEAPGEYVVRRTAGPGKRATVPTKLIASLPYAIALNYFVIEPVTAHYFAARIEDQVETYRARWDELIRDDFRFDYIRQRLERRELSPAEAEREAYVLSKAYHAYFAYAVGRTFTLADNEGLLKNFLFHSLVGPVRDGVKLAPGFRSLPGFDAKLNDDQKMRLFQSLHALYFRYQLIEAYLNGDFPPEYSGAIAALRDEPFTRELEARGLAPARKKHALQEHAYWDQRVKGWDIMRVQKEHPLDGHALTTADFDREILAD